MQGAEREIVISNRRGLHARASAKVCAVAATFDADVRVRKDDIVVGATSIMGLLMLGAGPGSSVFISATGPEAAAAVDALCALVADRFGEGE